MLRSEHAVISDRSTTSPYYSPSLAKVAMPVDSIDAKLLTALQVNSRQTTYVLGRLVGLSPTACGKRLKRLRAAKVVEAEVALVSPKFVARTVLAIVSVTLERDRLDIFNSFRKAVRAAPEVMQAYSVLGETDIVLVVTARDAHDFDEFTRRFFDKNSHIKGFKTTVVASRIKVGLTLPIESSE